jgi:hypothetical protein
MLENFHPIRYFTRTIRHNASYRVFRGIKEPHLDLGRKGITYTCSVGYVLRRLPTEDFNVLNKFLKLIATTVGCFRIIDIPDVADIVGIPEEDIPGIKWTEFMVSDSQHPLSKGDILGHFLQHCYDPEARTLALSKTNAFKEYMKTHLLPSSQVPLRMN